MQLLEFMLCVKEGNPSVHIGYLVILNTVFPGPKDALFFFPEKCDLNSTCIYAPRVRIIFKLTNTRTSIIQHLYHEIVKTTMKIILVAVMTIFWVSVMNKSYYGY